MDAVNTLADLFAKSMTLFKASAMRGVVLHVNSSHRIEIVAQVLMCLELCHHEGLWVDHACICIRGHLGH